MDESVRNELVRLGYDFPDQLVEELDANIRAVLLQHFTSKISPYKDSQIAKTFNENLRENLSTFALRKDVRMAEDRQLYKICADLNIAQPTFLFVISQSIIDTLYSLNRFVPIYESAEIQCNVSLQMAASVWRLKRAKFVRAESELVLNSTELLIKSPKTADNVRQMLKTIHTEFLDPRIDNWISTLQKSRMLLEFFVEIQFDSSSFRKKSFLDRINRLQAEKLISEGTCTEIEMLWKHFNKTGIMHPHESSGEKIRAVGLQEALFVVSKIVSVVQEVEFYKSDYGKSVYGSYYRQS